jgi:hypothetical protein
MEMHIFLLLCTARFKNNTVSMAFSSVKKERGKKNDYSNKINILE